MKKLVAIATVCVAATCILGAQRKSSDSKAEMMKADEEFSRATAQKGIDGFASFIADDFHTVRPNSPIIGKKEFVEIWKKMLDDKTLPSWKPVMAVISAGGDLGYTIGTAEFRKTDDPAKPVVGTSKYVTMWQKQKDGSWKVILDTGVNDR